jgi:hypothetical protein
MQTYETPAITELGSVADFTQGTGSDFQYDGGLDFWGTRVKPGTGGGGS